MLDDAIGSMTIWEQITFHMSTDYATEMIIVPTQELASDVPMDAQQHQQCDPACRQFHSKLQQAEENAFQRQVQLSTSGTAKVVADPARVQYPTVSDGTLAGSAAKKLTTIDSAVRSNVFIPHGGLRVASGWSVAHTTGNVRIIAQRSHPNWFALQ